MRHFVKLALLGSALLTGQAQAKGVIDCPMRDAAFSTESPLIDLLLNDQAKGVIETHLPGAIAKMPPMFSSTKAPSFAAILSFGRMAGMFGAKGLDMDKVDSELRAIPVTAADNLTISDAWQDGKPVVVNINIISNPEPGFGTHVTFGLPATNGYDQGINGNTSIRYLNSSGWNGVPTATNDGSVANSGIITDQPGYMLFVRGDRGTLLSQATGAVTSPTVLRPKGKINTGVLNQPLGIAFANAGSTFRVVVQ